VFPVMGKQRGKLRRRPVTAAVETSGKSKSLERLAGLVERRKRLDDETRRAVGRAREDGATWAVIGQELGVTGAGARQRWQPQLPASMRTIHRARSVAGEAARTRRSAGRQADAS
jgi:hypothetical protein